MYSRLYIFPFYVVKSAIFDSYEVLLKYETLTIIYYICNSFMIGLLCMNIYWFYLICKIAINSIRNGEVNDERED